MPRYRLSWRVDDAGIFYFCCSALMPLRISSLILAARLPSDPSIAAMISASVRRLSLAVIKSVFSRIQAFFASLSAIDFDLQSVWGRWVIRSALAWLYDSIGIPICQPPFFNFFQNIFCAHFGRFFIAIFPPICSCARTIKRKAGRCAPTPQF